VPRPGGQMFTNLTTGGLQGEHIMRNAVSARLPIGTDGDHYMTDLVKKIKQKVKVLYGLDTMDCDF